MESNVYIARCSSYEGDVLYKHVAEIFEYLGGVKKLIRPGMNVLIKPNLCLPQPPEKAITSHPILLEQIVKILVERNANVLIGDNPIGKSDKGQIEKLWEITGINRITHAYHCKKSHLDGMGFKREVIKLKGRVFSYYLSKEYLNADFVINVPKFKTHSLMAFTGAVKNMYGTVPGRSKVRLHSFAPGIEDFSKVLIDVFSKRVPELTIMDAIEGIEGDGPGIKGRKRRIGLLIASNDGVLVDSLCAQIMGLHAEDILTNVEAVKKNLGKVTFDNIYRHGFEALEEVFVKDFAMPSTRNYQNTGVIKKLFDIARFKVTIDGSQCRRCLLCYKNCPVRAIQKKGKTLTITQDKCIQCLCCQEICPHEAVDVVRNKFYTELQNLGKARGHGGHQCGGS